MNKKSTQQNTLTKALFMKQFYFTFFLSFFCSLAFAKETKGTLALTATISGGATVCQNASSPVITFTGAGGTAPYTFGYQINGGATLFVSTTGNNNSVTVSVNTSIAGTFNYVLINVEDSATPPVTAGASGSAVIIINPQPNANMGGTNGGSTFNGFDVFRVCSNISSTLNFTNTSTTTATNTNYTINWGDGSPNFSNTTWSTLSHTYPVGLWYLTYTILGSNGCSITKTYIVFVGSNPAVSLGNPGNTDICNANSLTFPITGTTNNPAGTTYTVTFNDGSTPQVFNHPPPSSVTHTFVTSSCGTTSSDGSNSYPNSFSANIVATNPCSTSSVGVVPIYVSANPQADFTIPPAACTNTQVCMENTSLGNQVINNTCSSPSIVWSISPSTGFSLGTGSSLGNDFSSTDPSLWLSGSQTLCVIFNIAGTYTITIKTGNKCGIDTESKTICVQPPLTPLFTLNTDSGCAPLAITATNNTNLSNQCTPPTYLWSVTYAPAYCGTSITPIPNQTTANASYNFTEPGIYTITLTTTNSCGSTTTTKTVTVKKPPTVSILPISNFCGTANINPTANINSCAPASSVLSYAWSFPGGTPSSSNLANPGTINYTTPGNYTVSLVVTNECGASTNASQNFTINVAPTITNTDLSQTICSGNQTTLVTLNVNPTGTTFTWSATATAGISGFLTSGTNTIPVQTIVTTNPNPGTVTYVITPSFNGCVGTPVNYVINVNPAPLLTTQPTSSSVCLNGNPTLLTVNLNNSSGSPTYQWYVNSNNSTTGGTLISGATNNTYQPPADVIGTFYYYCEISLTSGGCSSLTSNIGSVVVNPQPTISTQPTVTQNGCVGFTITSPLSVSYSGGVGTASYQWYSNTSNSNVGGSIISGATNTTYLPPTYTTSGNFYYYVVISLNGNGCNSVSSNVAEVIIFDDPTITTQPIPSQTLCQGATATILEVNANGGNGSFNYQWYSNTADNTSTGTLITGATSNTFTPPTTSVGTVYYYSIITQSTPGCSVTSTTASVTINVSPSINNQPTSSVVCLNGTPSTLQFSFTNGAGTATYQWYVNTTNNSTTGTAIVGATNATYIPPTDSIGILYYYCLVSFSGINGSCSTIATNVATVEVIPGATIDQNPLPSQNVCVGGIINNLLSVTFTGGTGTPSYQWFSNTINSNSGGTLIGGANGSTYLPPVFTSEGSYFYYVEINFSGSGCGAITSDVAEIVVVDDPIITAQPLPNQILCQNAIASILSATVSGGITGSYNYQWYVSTTNSTTDGIAIAGETNDTFIPQTTTVGTFYYYCIVSQPNGADCIVTSEIATIVVNLSPAINNQPISNTICLGESTPALSFTIVNGIGTPNYQWFFNTINANTGGTLITGAINATFTPNVSTVGTIYYYCVVTFPDISGGCEIITTDAIPITVNQTPVINAENTTICSGTTFTIIPLDSGSNIIPSGTTYTWTTPIVNPAGTITGATAQNIPQTEISQNLINLTSNVATVTYTVIPLSGNCLGDPFTVTVTVNPSINPNITLSNITCFQANNGSITTNITGGIPPYTITWTGPNGFNASSSSISNLEPGTYTLLIEDTGDCPYSESFVITEPNDISISLIQLSNITCFNENNGSIEIDVNGGSNNFIYNWTKDSVFFSNSQNITNLEPGIYEISVVDSNNCGPKTATFTITEPPLLQVSLVNQTNIECFGNETGAIQVVSVGGTIVSNYNFLWTGPNGYTSTDQNISNLIAGSYDLTVTDDNGCSVQLSVTLTQSPEIIISYTTTPISCYGANDASLSVTLSGGIPPYQFSWNNLSTALSQNNLSAGDYIITVTDNLGCSKTETINIPEAPIFTTNPVVTQISCNGANNGSINLNLTGGIAPVTLQWSDGSSAGLIRNNLPPGIYTATIVDGTPCTITQTFTIIEPQPLVISAVLTQPINCTDAASGAINLIVSGGTPPFTYSWSNGSSTEDLSSIVAGNYAITVLDANGCSASNQFTLIRPNPLTINVNTTTNANCETREVTQFFVADATGGVPPYTFQWSSGTISGNNNQIMQTDIEGSVIVTVTDNIGCSTNFTVNVDNPEIGNPAINLESVAFLTYGIYSVNDPIQFFSNATGDYENIVWDFGDGTFSNEENPIHTYAIEKEYIVKLTVTYPFGCVYVLTISLLVEKGYLLVIPSAFTPNNDGVNDTFRPVTKYLKKVQMDVYDSWGSMIYSETGEVLVGWNGKLNGITAENGNYYSVITAETFYGKTVQQNQTFVLIK